MIWKLHVTIGFFLCFVYLPFAVLSKYKFMNLANGRLQKILLIMIFFSFTKTVLVCFIKK